MRFVAAFSSTKGNLSFRTSLSLSLFCLFGFLTASAQTTCNYIWANWTDQGTTNNAVATINANGQFINMTMSANYNFAFTPGIFSYGSFSGFPFPPPNGTVPRTDWSAGPGGQTTMCFSSMVSNPVLLLSSIGNPSTPVTLTFSLPYNVLYNGGGCTFTTTTSLVGQEGYCILEFPGTFNCVTINSSTPEYYSNLTWGIRNPLNASYTFSNVCQGDSMHFSSAGSSINLPASISGYNWDFGDGNSSTLANPAHLYSAPGTYTVLLTATANNGCTDTMAQSVVVNPNPVVNLGADINICQGQTANLNAGNPGSNFVWNTGSLLQQISVATTGSYFVEVTNGNGCVGRDTIQVNVNPIPVVNLGPDTSFCAGQTTVLNAGNPGALYLWSSGAISQQITTGANGITWVNVTSGGCSARDSVLITVLANPLVNLGPDQNICQGNSVNLNAANPLAAHLWSTGATTQQISVSSSGNYSVRVTNGFGCIGRDTVQVTVHPNPIVNLGPDLSLCQGQSTTLNAGNPGSTFLWSTGAATQQISIGTSGLIWVNVSDGNGCASRDSFSLTVNPNPVVNLGNDVFLCPGDSLTLNAGNPGSTYLWSNGSTQQSTVLHPSGNFWVQVTDGNTCRDSDTIQLNLFSVPSGFLGPDDSLCQGQNLVLNAGNPGSTYLWWDGSSGQQHSVNASGTYWVQLTTMDGCMVQDSVTITALPLPLVNLGNDSSFCQGQSLVLDAGNPGMNYLWSNGSISQQITAGNSGNFSVAVSDAFGCTGRDTILITVFSNPVVNLGPDPLICQGQAITLNAGNPGSNFSWNDGSLNQTLSTSQSGTFSVTVTDANGCQGTDAVVVTVAPLPLVNLGPDITFCEGQTRILDAGNPGSTFLWSNASTQQSISIAIGGVYSVQVTDANGCQSADTLNAVQFPNPVVDLGPDRNICAGDSLLLNAGNAGSSFLWSDGSSQSSFWVRSGQVVSVMVTDVNGCTASDEIILTGIQLESFSLGADTTFCAVGEWMLNTTVNGLAYQWSTGAGGNSITVNQSGTYWLHIVQECGVVSDTIEITFTKGSAGPFTPNTFTPNGDGRNDLFRIESVYSSENFSLQIFDRWGRLVFSSNDPLAYWDGNFNGSPCTEDVYAYTYRTKNCNGTDKTIGGTVTLLR